MASKKDSLLAKALAAAAAAGQLLGEAPDGLSQPQVHSKTTEQIVQIIESDETLQSVQRAYLLMRLADCLLNKAGLEKFRAQFDNNRSYKNSDFRRFQRTLDLYVARLTDRADIDFALRRKSLNATQASLLAVDKVELKQAQMALIDSVNDLDKIVDPGTRNKMYFIAFHLLNQAGEHKQATRCRELVMNDIISAESSEAVREPQVSAAAAILNLIAFKIIPIEIPDFYEPSDSEVVHYSNQQKIDAERIKLRALHLLDRLPVETHSRRKAHRDLALYYLKLNEDAKSTKQKELLFELVGWRSDKVLYPQVGGCGHPIWWLKEPPKVSFMCGMG